VRIILKTGKVLSILQYIHAFFANSELLLKDYVSYLWKQISFQLYKSCGFNIFIKLCKSIIRSVSSVIVYWTHRHGVTGLNPGQVNFLSLSCSVHVVILYYTKNSFYKVLYVLNIKTIHHFMVLLQVVLSVDPTSQVCSSAMLVLPIVGNLKVRFEDSPQWHKVHTKFNPNLSSGSWVESCREMDSRHDQLYMHSFHAHHVMNAK
jgi:hypothetical protein